MRNKNIRKFTSIELSTALLKLKFKRRHVCFFPFAKIREGEEPDRNYEQSEASNARKEAASAEGKEVVANMIIVVVLVDAVFTQKGMCLREARTGS